jgi:hypothetical protein
MIQNRFEKAIKELPVHVASPLNRLVNTSNCFKKIHLISDVLLGCFRLYGTALINIAETEDVLNDSTEQAIETLMTKDSHGLWSSTILKLIQELDKKKSQQLSVELASIFGVNVKSVRPSIKRMTIKNTVIDGKGQKQMVEVTNTPVELLINFRNKYVGHGTVYSEIESKQIYDTYEPILIAFIDSLLDCKDFQFIDADTNETIHGHEKSSSGKIALQLNDRSFNLSSEHQLAIVPEENDLTNDSQSLTVDDFDNKIIETYPYFLAHPYKRALFEEDSFKRLHLLKEVFLNYLKYLGLLTTSEYFNSNLKIGEINRAFKSFLYRPQFGHWNAFMRSAIQALNDHEHNWFVKELPGYYKEVETDPYAMHGETSIGKLIHFRNHYLGHSTVPSDQECISIWNENFALLKGLLVKLDFCRNYTIVSSDKTVSWRLMGDEITQVNLRQKLKSNVAILNADNQELSIVPFFILPGEYFIREVSDRAKLMVYEQNTGSRIVFFSPESVHGETNNEKVLEQLNLLIREKEKQDPVAIEDLNENSWKALLKENNEATIQSLLSEKKVIKGIYQERQDAEVALRSWVGARAGLFFLAAEAGSGKTNLLVEMNRQYAERGLDTILLRGNRFRTPDIWEELCYRLNLTPESSFENADFVKYEQENPLMILIDGANENSNSKALFESIIQFLNLHKGGHIKILLSWRASIVSELPMIGKEYVNILYRELKSISEEAASISIKEENLINKFCFWLGSLNYLEIENLWRSFASYKSESIGRKPYFSYEELVYHDRAITNSSIKKNSSDKLDNPLLLRTFLEYYNGKGLPKINNQNKRDSLWGIYSRSFDDTVLNRICELMIIHEKSSISLDELYDDELIGDFVRTIQIDSPYQKIINSGILTEHIVDGILHVKFTIENFFHFLLGEIITLKYKNRPSSELKNIMENNKLHGIKEGVENCLINDVFNGDLNRIVELVDSVGDSNIKYIEHAIAYAFLTMNPKEVFNKLLYHPTMNDWRIIKNAREIVASVRNNSVIDWLDGILKESIELDNTIVNLYSEGFNINKVEILFLINLYTELHALDKAKELYSQFINEAEKYGDFVSLVEALEYLGNSEYKRSGQDGYRAAMDALTRAATIRESESSPQKDKLKNTYRLLGFAYLSLGLQVIKSTEYFEKAKAIMLEESSDSAELAEINLYIGLVNFWRGLRGVGRWGHADPTLLEGLDIDLFEYADSQFQMAYNHNFKHLGKTHPQTFKTLHYLQENRYAMGNYQQAIQWLKKYVDALPFKTREHTDNFYQYCLIVSLEESAKRIASSDKAKALAFIQEAISYCKHYDQNNQITQRLLEVKKQVEEEDIIEHQYTTIDKLAPLDEEKDFKGVWSKWEFSEQLTGFQTNNWMSDDSGIWFFNGEKKQLIYWSRINNAILEYNPSNWPEGCGRLVFDSNNQKFYAWSSIRSTVYELNSPDGTWNRLSHGVHDVHACGASFAFDPINNRLFEFGGYGYFTYKNWLWVYDLNEKKWIQLKENKPGISPYPRNGQLLPIENGTKAILVSGIGSDTGIQREHKARLGLASATDVGYFTWLRDAHILDLKNMDWQEVLPSNHDSIQHEGAMGYIEEIDVVVNFSGNIPSPIFGQEAATVNQCSIWKLKFGKGFKNLKIESDIQPAGGGNFVSFPANKFLLYKINEEIYKFELTSL